jgi:hypothetical protein
MHRTFALVFALVLVVGPACQISSYAYCSSAATVGFTTNFDYTWSDSSLKVAVPCPNLYSNICNPLATFTIPTGGLYYAQVNCPDGESCYGGVKVTKQ